MMKGRIRVRFSMMLEAGKYIHIHIYTYTHIHTHAYTYTQWIIKGEEKIINK